VKPLFHITTRAAWDRCQGAGEYRHESLAREGFLHLSTEDQWRHTLQRLFRGVEDLVVLEIDPARVQAEIRYESADGELFPHLYGALATGAVVRVREAPRMVALPAELIDRLKQGDDAISDVVACAITERGRPSTFVVLAAKPGRAGQISLADAIARGRLLDTGWMQIHSLPRQVDGTLDEVALLAYVESLAAT